MNLVLTEPFFSNFNPFFLLFLPQNPIFHFFFGKKMKIKNFRTYKKIGKTKLEKRALLRPVEMFSELNATNQSFLSCFITKIWPVTASERCWNKILRKSYLNLETPNLHIWFLKYFILKNIDTVSRFLLCTVQELRNFKGENVKYSWLKNNKKQQKLRDLIFFVFYCF